MKLKYFLTSLFSGKGLVLPISKEGLAGGLFEIDNVEIREDS